MTTDELATRVEVVAAQPGWRVVTAVYDAQDRVCDLAYTPVLCWQVTLEWEADGERWRASPLAVVAEPEDVDEGCYALEDPEGRVFVPHEGDYPEAAALVAYFERRRKAERARQQAMAANRAKAEAQVRRG